MLRVAAAGREHVSATTPLQPVLWAGRDAPPTLLRELLAECGYAMHDRNLDDLPTRRVAWLAPASLQARDKYDLTQRRIGVLHPEPGAADALAEALRARGAQVIVLSLGEAGLKRAEALDPDVILVRPEHFAQGGRTAVAALWEHLWLCWTPILFVPAERLGIADASAPDVREVAVGIHMLCADYELTLRRARRPQPFQLRLEQLGPVRTLRALLESQSSLRVRVETSQRTYELDVGEGLVIGASAALQRASNRDELLGVDALKSLLTSTAGQVSVRTVAQPALTNVMAPLEALLLSERATPSLADVRLGRESVPQAFGAEGGPSLPVAVPALFLRIPADNSASMPSTPAATDSRGSASQSDPADDDTTAAFSCPTPSTPEAVVPAGGADETKPDLQSLLSAHKNRLLSFASKLFDEVRSQLQRHSAREVIVAGVVVASAVMALTAWLMSGAPEVSSGAPPRPPRIASSAQLPDTEARDRVSGQAAEKQAKPSTERAQRTANQAAADLRGGAAEEQAPSIVEDELLAQEQAGTDARREAAAHASQLVRKGNKLRRRGRLRAAHDAYRDALEAFPRFPRALSGLTEVALAQGDAEKALDRVAQLLQERHRFPDDQRLLGDVYMLAGRSDEAQTAWRRAARQGSSVARARLKELTR